MPHSADPRLNRSPAAEPLSEPTIRHRLRQVRVQIERLLAEEQRLDDQYRRWQLDRRQQLADLQSELQRLQRQLDGRPQLAVLTMPGPSS